jgi:hypothetical protein
MAETREESEAEERQCEEPAGLLVEYYEAVCVQHTLNNKPTH